MTATQTQATTTTIPLNKLIVSADNVRKTGGGVGIDELAASISAHGVLQNLIVRFPEDDAKGRYEVIAGGRRLAALHMLAKSKKIAKTFPVPCVVRAPDEATELSLAENTKRLAMHPADEFAAYHALSQQGAPACGDRATVWRFHPACRAAAETGECQSSLAGRVPG